MYGSNSFAIFVRVLAAFCRNNSPRSIIFLRHMLMSWTRNNNKKKVLRHRRDKKCSAHLEVEHGERDKAKQQFASWSNGCTHCVVSVLNGRDRFLQVRTQLLHSRCWNKKTVGYDLENTKSYRNDQITFVLSNYFDQSVNRWQSLGSIWRVVCWLFKQASDIWKYFKWKIGIGNVSSPISRAKKYLHRNCRGNKNCCT